ncbi:hypothetical protein PV325_005289, partial [Microctonus aethiopoides]
MGRSLNTLSVTCAENKYMKYTPATESSPSTLVCAPCPLDHKLKIFMLATALSVSISCHLSEAVTQAFTRRKYKKKSDMRMEEKLCSKENQEVLVLENSGFLWLLQHP